MNINKINTDSVGFFRFKRLADDYLLTNDIGEYCFLEPPLFKAMVTGDSRKLERKDPAKFEELTDGGFLRKGLNPDTFVHKYCSKNMFLSGAPFLHIVVVTLRCDHRCIYCQSKAGTPESKQLDMDIATAEKVVDKIFDSSSPSITIEFQGGEPLINFETVKFIIEYAKEKNKRVGKKLRIALVSNLSYADKEKLGFLMKNEVSICTSLDGPQHLHNKNRVTLDKKKNSYKNTVKWLNYITKEFQKKKYKHKPNALSTISRFSLAYPREIVDEFLKAGLESIQLRPATTFIFSGNTPGSLRFQWSDFIRFYKKAFDYILEVNLKGKIFFERAALTFLTKILSDSDPNFLDTRSPCGAGIGQIAYNYNGDVYTCDEGRMMSRIGDESFRIGNVRTSDYSQIITHPTVKAMCIASCLDNLPGCSDCVYKTYCGVCPLMNYADRGSVFAQQPCNESCKIQKAILDHLFEKIRVDKYRRIFENWLDYTGVKKR